jgi:hypothetical protein
VPVVNIEGLGRVSFPDDLDEAAITRAIEKEILPQARRAALKQKDPSEYDPESPLFKAKYGATSGMGGLQKFAAGYGKATVDLGRGLGQYGGMVSRQDVADSRSRDAELLSSGAGRAGNIVNSVAMFAPTAAIPGANTVAGAAAIGAGIGATQPSTSTGETVKNTALGGVFSAGGLLAGRGLAAGYRGGKALIEPLTKGGQERIAARTLEAYAGGRQGAQQAASSIAQNSADVLPGYKPTTAELAGNAGLSQLERTVKNNPEYLTAFTDRARGNTAAVVDAVDTIAQGPAALESAKAARSAAAKPLYDAATKGAARADAEFGKLVSRPSMSTAWDKAQALASEAGEQLPPAPDMTGKSLHYLKMAMDDLADNPAANGFAGNQARAVKDTRAAFMSWLEKAIPEYKTARTTYAQMSRPVNQMEVGQALKDKLVPAMNDFTPGGGAGLRPNAFAQAMRDGDALAARTLDRNSASLADIMEPAQMGTLNQIGRTVVRKTTNENLGRAVGSNTGQNIVSQNVVRQFLGPLGLPESTMQRAAESTLLQTVMRPAQWAGKLGEQRAMSLLAEAALDPKIAEEMLRIGVPAQKVGMLRFQGLLGPTAASGTNAAKQ